MLYEDPASGTYVCVRSWSDPCIGEPSTYMAHVATLRADVRTEDRLHSAALLLRALYSTEVRKKIASDTYKTASRAPVPMGEEVLLGAETEALGLMADPSAAARLAGDPSTSWSSVTAGALFVSGAAGLAGGEDKVFDKDHGAGMRWVCAAAALRCHVFGIQVLSLHACKGVAGNIIPAIATTNAIVAGIQTQQAFNVIASGGAVDVALTCKHTYVLRSRTRKGLYIQPTAPEPPNLACFACGTVLTYPSLPCLDYPHIDYPYLA